MTYHDLGAVDLHSSSVAFSAVPMLRNGPEAEVSEESGPEAVPEAAEVAADGGSVETGVDAGEEDDEVFGDEIRDGLVVRGEELAFGGFPGGGQCLIHAAASLEVFWAHPGNACMACHLPDQLSVGKLDDAHNPLSFKRLQCELSQFANSAGGYPQRTLTRCTHFPEEPDFQRFLISFHGFHLGAAL